MEHRDIMTERVGMAFQGGAFSKEITNYIARGATEYGHGDARPGIQLLCVAGSITNLNQKKIF